MKIADCLVQNRESQDDVLHRSLFPVNIRLLQANKDYLRVIENVVRIMERTLYTSFSNYAELQGLSGANVGIPFNIILIRRKDTHVVLLNPEVIDNSVETREVESNCGSLNLKEAMKVKRYKRVTVKYYPFPENSGLYGKGFHDPKEEEFKCGTIQHEIDHNNGILITDK